MYAIDNPAMKIAAMHHSYESFERSELVMKLKGDLSIKSESLFTKNYKEILFLPLMELIYAAQYTKHPKSLFLHYGINRIGFYIQKIKSY
jgi:hypothetical protein